MKMIPGNYINLSRRSFLGLAGLLMFPGSMAGAAEPKASEEGEKPRDPFLRFGLNVHIIGDKWASQEDLSANGFTERERGLIENGAREFVTLGLATKSLVMFDLYRIDGGKRRLVAGNIKEDNYGDIILKRPQGNVEYELDITSPLTTKIEKMQFTFVTNEDIYKTLFDSENPTFIPGFEQISNYGSNDSGFYPRRFSLVRQGVRYDVCGLESLAGPDISPEIFERYWAFRKSFKGGIDDFQIFYKRFQDAELEFVSPFSEAGP